jgi:hypothetical protein
VKRAQRLHLHEIDRARLQLARAAIVVASLVIVAKSIIDSGGMDAGR